MTKGLFMELRQEEKQFTDLVVDVIELNELEGSEDGRLIQAYLLEKTGQRTVPNVFIGQGHVGGNSDLQQLYATGKLKDILESLIRQTSTTASTTESEL
jgi:glutaredoxin